MAQGATEGLRRSRAGGKEQEGSIGGPAWLPGNPQSFSLLRYGLDDIYSDCFDVAIHVVDHVPLKTSGGHDPTRS